VEFSKQSFGGWFEKTGFNSPFFHDEFVELVIEGDRVVAVKAGHAEIIRRLACGAHHAVHI
jgi:hypothetical protein